MKTSEKTKMYSKLFMFYFVLLLQLVSVDLLFSQYTLVEYKDQSLLPVFVVGEPPPGVEEHSSAKNPGQGPSITHTLVIKDNKSYQSAVDLADYGIAEAENLSEKSKHSVGGGKMIGLSSDMFTYKDLDNDIYFSKAVFVTNPVWIYDRLPKIAWKIEKETQKVGNYLCRKATAVHRGKPILAWFTDQIPVSTGPGEFSGLPGLILILEMDNRLFRANKIVRNANIDFEFPKPEKKANTIDLASFQEKADKIMGQLIEALKSSKDGNIQININN